MATPAPALTRFLHRLQQHSCLTSEEQSALLQLDHQELSFAAHRDLVRPGDTINHATLVSEGILGRYEGMRSGTRQITALFIPGDMSDLHSVVVPSISWGLTSLSKATILRVPHAQLAALASSYPNLAMAFWRDTTLDASILARAAANIGRLRARSRLAHLFCELGIRMERAGLGRRDDYPLRLIQEQIGDIAALTAVHVNRTLSDLRERELMSFSAGRVIIHRWEALASEGEFRPGYLLGAGR